MHKGTMLLVRECMRELQEGMNNFSESRLPKLATADSVSCVAAWARLQVKAEESRPMDPKGAQPNESPGADCPEPAGSAAAVQTASSAPTAGDSRCLTSWHVVIVVSDVAIFPRKCMS